MAKKKVTKVVVEVPELVEEQVVVEVPELVVVEVPEPVVVEVPEPVIVEVPEPVIVEVQSPVQSPELYEPIYIISPAPVKLGTLPVGAVFEIDNQMHKVVRVEGPGLPGVVASTLDGLITWGTGNNALVHPAREA